MADRSALRVEQPVVCAHLRSWLYPRAWHEAARIPSVKIPADRFFIKARMSKSTVEHLADTPVGSQDMPFFKQLRIKDLHIHSGKFTQKFLEKDAKSLRTHTLSSKLSRLDCRVARTLTHKWVNVARDLTHLRVPLLFFVLVGDKSLK